MDRRSFMIIAGIGGLASLNRDRAWAQSAQGADFSWDGLREQAQKLAASPYAPPTDDLHPALAELNYDDYRRIKFRLDEAIWRDRESPVQMQLFHDGYLYRQPVEIHIVENGKAKRLDYDTSLFDFGPAEKRTIPEGVGGFSGFRLHAPMMRPDIFEEFLVFQGASYFRSRAKGQTYGLSARGLAIDTAQAGGEEFPAFRSFWVEKPGKDDETVTIYALMDSESATGAYRFLVSRKVDVVMDIDCAIFPRKPLSHAGIAPFSSMYYFGPADHTFHDDFRPRVHDSDGLLMWTGKGDWVWRPLVTANHVLYSMFSDASPRGFGLMQRQRGFDAYQDLNADYEKRPGVWVEPLSDWGEGSVDLVELPTRSEYMDNIVAFWRPKEPLQPGQRYDFRYRLNWCWHVPVEDDVARVVQTRAGRGLPQGSRYITIDFAGGPLYAQADAEHWDYEVSASTGLIRAYTIDPHPVIDGKRVSVEFHPEGDKTADLTFRIKLFGKPLTERWVYRWAP